MRALSSLAIDSVIPKIKAERSYTNPKLISGRWKLLEFRMNYDTGDLLHSATIDTSHVENVFWSGQAQIHSGNSQLLFITPAQMVFDTRTHMFYGIRLREDIHARFVRVIVSDTSLIALSGLDYEANNRTAIYILALPPDSGGGETSSCTLCLTHKGLISHIRLSHAKLVKHAIDPATGAMTISLLIYSRDLDPLELQRVDMTLPKCTPGAVTLPINIQKRPIQLPRERVRPSRYESHRKYIDIFADGQIRGFYRADQNRQRELRPWETDENMLIMKFSIDTTQEPWVITRSQIAPAEWSNEEDPGRDPTGDDISVDGMRGRLCYPHPEVTSRLIVADIE